MKIFFASQSFYPHIGGVSTYLLNLAKGLQEKGHEVTEVHLRPPHEANEEEVKGIKVYRVPQEPIDKELLEGYSSFKENIYNGSHSLANNFTKPVTDMKGFEEFSKINLVFGEQVAKLLKRDPAEIVHIQDFQLIFLYKYVPRGIPLILTWHIPFLDTMSQHLKEFLVKNMREYDRVIFSSPDYIKAAIKAGLPKEKTVLIYPIANTNLFKVMEVNKEEIRRRYNLPLNNKLILCVQRIDAKSGHEQLIKALPIVIKEVPDVKLIFVGSESLSTKISASRQKYQDNVHKLINDLNIKDYVVFVGNIDYYELPKVGNVVEMVTLTSKIEGFGLSLNEGMCCGKAVLGTRTGGIPLQIEDNINGFLVDVGDIENTAKKIITILKNDVLREKMGKESLRIIKDKFAMSIGIEAHIKLYHDLLKEKHEAWGLATIKSEELEAFITDYDRTITTKEPGILKPIMIKELKSLKIPLILVTGRNLFYVKELYKKYPLWKCIIAENGAVIYLPKYSQTIIFDSDHMRKARNIIKEKSLRAVVGRVIISLPLTQLKETRLILKDLNKHLNYERNIDEFMILPKRIDKGTGLKLALQYLDIEPEKTIIIGDAENDIDLFNVSGFRIAVANAPKRLRVIADHVTKGEYNQGVIEVINKLH
jgi:sucrose-phosphate phosphatase subfamily